MNKLGKEAPRGKVAELFAGVGGFRIGLEKAGWPTVFSNQWEPSTVRQHASEVYLQNFGPAGHTNVDIAQIDAIPAEFDLLVGGFPCQDYSVAKSKSSALGIQGKKGVLWWEILRLTEIHRPRFLFLENVDRLLKSPGNQRGRDFAIMLSSLGSLGYSVEWRVVNAADYGFPQRRRRVFIVADLLTTAQSAEMLLEKGVLAETFPSKEYGPKSSFSISENVVSVSERFGLGEKLSPFKSAGSYLHGGVVTQNLISSFGGKGASLSDVLLPIEEIPDNFFIDPDSLPRWEYLKGAKSEKRRHESGFEWTYSEGSMAFPDPTERPSRTVLTGEGGPTPSRFKHVVEQGGRLRRLHPIELERLNGFPDDWTRLGIHGEVADAKRAFFMGNALVVGLVEMVGNSLARRLT